MKLSEINRATSLQGSDSVAGIQTVGGVPAPRRFLLSDLASYFGSGGGSGGEPVITAGSTGQYWRGDKTWQALNASAVGLGNVSNTSDAAKPVSTAQQSALDLKLNASAVSGFGLSLVDDVDAPAARSTLGLGYFATGTDAANLTGTIAAARMPSLTGDVTSSAGSTALTIAANAVTFPKFVAATAAGFVGATAAGNFSQLTPAQAKSVLAITEADVANLTSDLAAKASLASPQFTGVAYYQQAAPTAKTATGTLTIAELLSLIITATSAAAVSLTLPTGTLTDAGILAGALAVNGSFEWCLVNLGSSSGAVTLVAGTGHTIVGNALTAIATTSRWLTRKTAANTFVTYRIA